jgi:hypothetical protein
MGIIWILIIFMLYALIGTFVCNKIDALYGSDDFLETIVDGILITFWPITLMSYVLFDLND